MADLNRQSVEEQATPPQLPTHDSQPLDISPTPSKSVHRSKTVRNLNSAGNKMRGFFNKKKDNGSNSKSIKSDDNTILERPVLTTSASYGATSGNTFTQPVVSLPKTGPKDSVNAEPNPENSKHSSTTLSIEEAEQKQQFIQQQATFQQELDQLNELINTRRQEVQTEKQNKERLQAELAEAQRAFQEQESQYAAIEHSFFEHTRSIRATDDDLSTIQDSFKLLKYSIARLIMSLNKKADKERAAQKFAQVWPDLVLEASLVNPLAEKLVHQHLIREVFGVPIYLGLPVNKAYSVLSGWLQQFNSGFAMRLRQQMAAIVAKSKPEGEIQQEAQKEKWVIAHKIYDDLAEIYHPFLKENDAAVDEEKRYLHKISDIVDKALKLTVAIRGQEVDITTVAIEEGVQEFDEETMVEVKGRTEGRVRFCICPAFKGGDLEHGFLEKAKVIVFD